MNIICTITAYPPSIGGAQIHQHLLAQELSRLHHIEVISQWSTNRTDWLIGTTLGAPAQSSDYVIDGIPIHQIGLTRRQKLKLLPHVLLYYPWMSHALPRISTCLKRHLKPFGNQADLIHNVRFGREGLSYASFELAREHKIPFVFTPLHHPRWMGWRYKAYTQLYQKADAIITLTNAEKATLIDLGVLPERIHVTGIGPVLAQDACPEQFLTEHQIDGPVVLFLGQHYPYKGYQQLLEASQIVWRRVPEAHFVFIGPAVGKSEQIFKPVKDKRIHRLGKVDLQIKTNALAACTLLCVPSTQESFGGVYTEAWSFQKPVIGCQIPAVAEVITHAVDGYLVEQTASEIANHIVDLLLDSNKAKAMGAMGRRKVDEHYNWSVVAKRTEQVYYSVL